MATISIDFNADKNEVYLLGDISSLKANRFAWRYMRDYLHPVEDGERLIVSAKDEDPIVIMSKIRSMLEKYRFIEKRTETSEKVLLDFYEEEQKFKELSKES